MTQLRKGDLVEVLTDYPSSSYWRKGDRFVITSVVADNCCWGSKKGKDGENFVNPKYLRKIDLPEANHSWEYKKSK